jgi:peptide/nickel transport system permease protein
MTTGVLRASAERRYKAGLGLAHIAFSDPLNVVAFGLLALIVLMAIFGPYVVPYDPLRSSALEALLPPSTAHWFGTDDLGRDVFSRVVVAARLDMLISVSAVALSLVAGSAIGLLAGFYGGWFDRISGRVIDTIMAFPLFVLAMGIVAAAGNTVANVVYATAIINLPFYARLVRAETLTRRDAGFVQAARLCGNPDWRILIFHIFPNVLPPLMITVSLNMGWSIMNAAGLSFIGLGVQPPTAEWGILVAQGANYIVSGEWWIALFPGAMLMLAVFTFNLLGDYCVTWSTRFAGFETVSRRRSRPMTPASLAGPAWHSRRRRSSARCRGSRCNGRSPRRSPREFPPRSARNCAATNPAPPRASRGCRSRIAGHGSHGRPAARSKARRRVRYPRWSRFPHRRPARQKSCTSAPLRR